MPRAVIKGEVHASRKDRDALLDHDLAAFDAIFVEQQPDVSLYGPFSLSFVFYMFGVLEYKWLARKIYFSKRTLLDDARERGVAVHGIDAPLRDHNRLLRTSTKLLLFIIALLTAGSLFGGGIVSLLAFAPLAGTWNLATLLLFLLVPILSVPFFYFLYSVPITVHGRDRYMADRINTLTEEHGYDTVLVSVGDCHRDSLARLLQDYDDAWQVETKASETTFSRFSLAICKSIRKLTTPLQRPVE